MLVVVDYSIYYRSLASLSVLSVIPLLSCQGIINVGYYLIGNDLIFSIPALHPMLLRPFMVTAPYPT